MLQQTDGQRTNPVYSLGHSHEQNIHTRLRLGLSSLSEHVFKYNLPLYKFCQQCTGNHTGATEYYIHTNVCCPNLTVVALI
jgi:hypothetical protein